MKRRKERRDKNERERIGIKGRGDREEREERGEKEEGKRERGKERGLNATSGVGNLGKLTLSLTSPSS